MPWINEEMCAACGICVDQCPAGAISISGAAAVINADAVSYTHLTLPTN